ncbi:hypothetical protein F3Y22_tig00110007pilonHSYRG00124 [Hibiscus syriacus]|uniref:Protein kinase domain-containing protein n=1 Tax=Hibiscus syriacus TaxID=106335 RepID=A0A6A3BRV0_HIBSY|nr:hypothetical protein F3Y22_tig00110007pilonHSYRG00124 [Hibiscus syriacus]
MTMISISRQLELDSANFSDNICHWKGVTCNSPSNTFIISLSFSGFGLSNSSFLPLVCQIDSLQSLDFSNNKLKSIPGEFFNSCGEINGLKSMNFSRNMLSGSLPTFQKFAGLESLDLSFNLLSGDIDSQLNDLSALKSLNLSSNHFNGAVPNRLGKSKVLERLELSVNNLTGNIPSEIGEYGNLIMIDLSGNKINGTIPESVGNLTNLEILILSSNQLSGAIPAGLLVIKNLQRFSANQNMFVTLPSTITNSLKMLDLSYNEITGSIPPEFLLPLSLQTVDLSYNMLNGSIPEIMSSSLVRIRMGSNFLSGLIPGARFASLPNLTYLELENNSFTGTIPPQIGSCQKLALLNLAQNKLDGALPVELLKLTQLQVLKLQLNNLGGEIPSQIGHLNILHLQNNDLIGFIPDGIKNLKFLLELQLGKNKLQGRIPDMPSKLQISLNLSCNLFEGDIPKTLSGLNDLEVLDLSNNKFSGEVPDFLLGLSSLSLLILSNNRLSGVLPNFSKHVTLYYSGNELFPPQHNFPVSHKNRKPIAMTIGITLAATAVAVVLVASVSLLISRRFYKQMGSIDPIFDFTKAMEAVVSPANIVLKTRFSTYYKALMASGAIYYVKKLNWSDRIFQLGCHDKFEQELEVLGKLSNSNIMIPLAYVLTVDNAYLFYEFAPKGTLYDVLHGSSKNSLDWASRYSIAVGVAQGLAFLHGCSSSPVLLLDLSSRSIVLKSLKEPQVGDIELCKVIDPSKTNGSLSTVAGSVGYIPPEYAYTMRVTMAGNVYSFGVVLLELLTGKAAVSEGTELANWVLLNSARPNKLNHILDFNISRTSVVIRNQMLAVLKVALACVSGSPESRPKMKSVLGMILNAR